MTDKEAQFYGRILELEIKSRLNTLTDLENREMCEVVCKRHYGERILDAIRDLSFDIVSGKLSSLR